MGELSIDSVRVISIIPRGVSFDREAHLFENFMSINFGGRRHSVPHEMAVIGKHWSFPITAKVCIVHCSFFIPTLFPIENPTFAS